MRLQQKRMAYTALANVYTRVDRAAQGERDSCGRATKAVLLAFAVQISSSMNVRPPLSKLGRTRRCRLRRLDWVIACVVAMLESKRR